MPRQRSAIAAILVPLVVGISTLSIAMQKPSVAGIRAVDILQLVGSGMCFGVALVSLFSTLRKHDG